VLCVPEETFERRQSILQEAPLPSKVLWIRMVCWRTASQ